MAWSGGTFTRSNGPTGWQNDQSASIGITAVRHDALDNDLATGINTCLTKDGQNSPTANLSMAGFKHTTVALGTARTDYPRLDQVQDSSFTWGGTSGGSANAQTLTLTPSPSTYNAGAIIRFVAGFTNTSATTININSIGVGNIQKVLSGSLTALVGGELIAGNYYQIISIPSTSNWLLLNPSYHVNSFSPGFIGNGLMTWPASATVAQYSKTDKRCDIYINAVGAPGGTLNTTLMITSLPFNSLYDFNFPLAYNQGSSDGGALQARMLAGTNTILCDHPNGSNWTTTTARVSGFVSFITS